MIRLSCKFSIGGDPCIPTGIDFSGPAYPNPNYRILEGEIVLHSLDDLLKLNTGRPFKIKVKDTVYEKDRLSIWGLEVIESE